MNDFLEDPNLSSTLVLNQFMRLLYDQIQSYWSYISFSRLTVKKSHEKGDEKEFKFKFKSTQMSIFQLLLVQPAEAYERESKPSLMYNDFMRLLQEV